MTASSRLKVVQLSSTYAVLDEVTRLKNEGRSILDLGGGEPDFDTPEHIKAAGIEAINKGLTHYTPSRGTKALLEAISEKLLQENGITALPDSQIIVTPSAKHALFISIFSVIDPGDEVIILTPSWSSYKEMVRIAGGVPIEVPISASPDITISKEDITPYISLKTKAIITNSPNNPTGKILSERECYEILALSKKHNLKIISDEIYEKVNYGEHSHFSIGSLSGAEEITLTVNGFSKGYAMTGWRLGYVAGPPDLISELLKLQQHSVGCASSFTQQAAIHALKGDQSAVNLMTIEYKRRRDFIVGKLNEISGIKCSSPAGSFYAFADISALGISDEEFCINILKEAGIAATPGTAFGFHFNSYIRFSFSGSHQAIADAMEKLKVFIHSNFSTSKK